MEEIGALLERADELRREGRTAEAERLLARAVELDPGGAEPHNRRGLWCLEEGRVEEATRAFECALDLDPGHAASVWNLATTQLLRGSYTEGWRLHERRPTVVDRGEAIDIDGFSTLRWSGGALEGKRILVIAEQGLGDQIQFMRFVPELARRGARVVLGLAPQLARLARSLEGVESVVTRVGESPGTIDLWTHLMSLPHYLDVKLESLPARVPYLRAPQDLVRGWGRELSRLVPSGRKVGVVWAGDRAHPNDRNRSIAAEAMSRLAGIPGVTLISLQKDLEPFEGISLPLGEHLTDMADTAAVMENLDRVISVDTAAAHLAGALGRPVWTLIPWAPDWRWMLARADSPWYPTMRLYRQSSRGDWSTAISELRRDLAALTEVPSGDEPQRSMP